MVHRRKAREGKVASRRLTGILHRARHIHSPRVRVRRVSLRNQELLVRAVDEAGEGIGSVGSEDGVAETGTGVV